MSDEYANLGSVRRRPRPGQQRTESEFQSNGKADGASSNGNGSYKTNGGPSGRSGSNYDEDEPRSRRQYDNRDNRERRRDRRDRGREDRDERRERPLPWREIAAEAPLFRCPFDPWRLFGAVKRKTASILLIGGILTIIGFFIGAFTVPYTMSLPLIRKTSNAWKSESALPNQFTPREYSDGTLYAFMKSPTVVRKVVQKAKNDPLLAPLEVTSEELAQKISVVPMANPDFVFIKLKTFGSMRAMASLINLYGHEAVDHMRFVQQNESAGIYVYLTNQLQVAENRIKAIQAEKQSLSDSGLLSYDLETQQTLADLRMMNTTLAEKKLKYDSLAEQVRSLDEAMPDSRILLARQELQDMLLTKTQKHPEVERKEREIEALEKQQKAGTLVKGATGSNTSDPLFVKRMDLITSGPTLKREIDELSARISSATNLLYQRKGKDIIYAVKQADYDSAIKARDEIQKAAREAQIYAEASLGYFGMPDEANEKSIDKKNRWLKVSLVALLFGFLGSGLTAFVALVGEALDTTLKTPEDIMRVCKLPVLATLGDLQKMSAKQQVDWAFRTLTLLKGKLNRNPDQALVCGITSANHGEGRSTWVNLLVNAASQRGLRVLTVDTRPATTAPASAPPPPKPEPVMADNSKAETAEKNGHSINLPDESAMPVAKDALSSPQSVTERFEGPSPQALVHIPLPGWVWSLERRKQWHNALDHWRHIDNLVIFVELPPACESESVLLAENLPQVIWLVSSGMPDAAETAAHLETLRHGHCNLVGAVLNHAPAPFLNSKIGRWLNPVTAIAFLAGSLCLNGMAADNANELQSAQTAIVRAQPAVMQTALSANAKRQRARWQERLTFGPGDIIDIHFYGNPSLSRTNVFIGPDGRINYLQATGLSAAGLTVEELRQKLDEELGNYYPAARTIVLPSSFASKKYYMLGKINLKGSFSLDRPLTLIEAVAKAKGLETGLYQRTTVELADLGHSFLVRDGQKLPVDFEKLFLEGDLSQNIPIEPNDYIYFASTAAQDIYVLGEVINPGPLGFVSSASVLTAITDRGGFSPQAFKRRVLVVRGSLNEPETFVINTDAALDGHLRDFRLQPRDIVYVSRRPWAKVEELGDEFVQSFIQGAITAWAGENIGPVITGRLFPRVK
jgi:protein involved in polysaccharide export with SLBB domain/capsular polysaccharide biosynthesis protein